jgi:hypothetical protein
MSGASGPLTAGSGQGGGGSGASHWPCMHACVRACLLLWPWRGEQLCPVLALCAPVLHMTLDSAASCGQGNWKEASLRLQPACQDVCAPV